MNSNELNKIFSEYNIKNVSTFAESSNKILLGKLNKKNVYIRKMENNENNRNKIEIEINILKHLSCESFPSVKPIENIPLIYFENYFYIVFEGIEGIAGWKCKSNNYYKECGKIIGKLHLLLDQINEEYSILSQNIESNDFNELLKEIKKELDNKILKINYGIIHSDLHSGNILLSNEKYYIIDFGSFNYGYRIVDLLNLAYEIFNEGIDVNKNMDILINNYQKYSSIGNINEKIINLLILEADISEYEIMIKRNEMNTNYFKRLKIKLENKEPSFEIGRYFA